MTQPEIHYLNQKFFLQIEGESVEISNPELLNSYSFRKDTKLPSGIGYRTKRQRWTGASLTKDWRTPDWVDVNDDFNVGEIRTVATLYVIEEEKEQPKNQGDKEAYNQAIDDVLRICDSGGGATRNEIEKLKK